MEISPTEIYNESQSQSKFVTRLKLVLSVALFALGIYLDGSIMNINICLSALNCLLILGLMEMQPRMLRDSLQDKDGKYAIPQAVLDWSSFILLVWLFLSTAITIGFF